MKKKAFIIVIILLLLGLVGYMVFVKKDLGVPSNIKGSTVEIKSLDESESYGSVWIEGGEIKDSITVEEINNFIEKNKQSWETEDQSYPTGGVKNGFLWDGEKITSIDEEDFILAIYVQLEEEFAGEYYIDLVEKK